MRSGTLTNRQGASHAYPPTADPPLQINGMLLVHLPDGPTAHFRLSNLKLGRDIKGHGRATAHKPELILNHFDTRLGHRVGRMFASLFPQDPQFRGRRVVTFHNQRDFIFVR